MVSSVTTALAELGNIAFGGGGQKFAAISAAAGENTLVAAVTNSRIRVLALFVAQEAHTNSTIVFESNDTALTGVIVNKNIDFVLALPFNPAGWFQTEKGEALKVTTAEKTAFGALVYEEVAVA